MIEAILAKLIERENLSVAEIRSAMEAIMEGKCREAEMAAFLTALRMKGETADEIVGAATVMRQHVKPICT
ncbi:MAG: anthranilate phosphoribosyltransferase, partial [Planctomycetes bacterium]|nr:anthranilate phosphoribosyltransferase [Planctomycetota bacterium]